MNYPIEIFGPGGLVTITAGELSGASARVVKLISISMGRRSEFVEVVAADGVDVITYDLNEVRPDLACHVSRHHLRRALRQWREREEDDRYNSLGTQLLEEDLFEDGRMLASAENLLEEIIEWRETRAPAPAFVRAARLATWRTGKGRNLTEPEAAAIGLDRGVVMSLPSGDVFVAGLSDDGDFVGYATIPREDLP